MVTRILCVLGLMLLSAACTNPAKPQVVRFQDLTASDIVVQVYRKDEGLLRQGGKVTIVINVDTLQSRPIEFPQELSGYLTPSPDSRKSRVSPDGKRIAFVGKGQEFPQICYGIDAPFPCNALFISDTDGEGVVRLTNRSDESIEWFEWASALPKLTR